MKIGNRYIVRTIGFIRNNIFLEWPVIDKSHKDSTEEHFLEEEHYHIDWRFMPEEELCIHRNHNQKLWDHWKYYENAEYLSLILKSEMINETYKQWIYKRDFGIVRTTKELENKMNRENRKMFHMTCPHRGYKLGECKIRNKNVQCPQHGLIWNIETGDLVISNNY